MYNQRAHVKNGQTRMDVAPHQRMMMKDHTSAFSLYLNAIAIDIAIIKWPSSKPLPFRISIVF